MEGERVGWLHRLKYQCHEIHVKWIRLWGGVRDEGLGYVSVRKCWACKASMFSENIERL